MTSHFSGMTDQNNWNGLQYQMNQMGMGSSLGRQSIPTIKQGIFPGRIINNPDEVMPNEVPSNGNPAIFPSTDWSCIWVKAYGADGLIHPLCYRLDQPDTSKQPSEFDQVMQRLNKIEETMIRLMESKKNQQNRKWNPNKNNNQPKKEEQINE